MRKLSSRKVSEDANCVSQTDLRKNGVRPSLVEDASVFTGICRTEVSVGICGSNFGLRHDF
jgi:hypothetical protein